MVKFSKTWKLHARGGEKVMKKYKKEFDKRTQVPSKLKRLKTPIGKHTHAVYYRPILLRR